MAHTTPLSAPAGTPHGALHPIASSRLQGMRGRPDPLSVGVIVWLASELMFFAALFAAYFSLREITNAAAAKAGATPMWEWGAAHLDNDWFGVSFPWFATINTTILILSSVNCQQGVHAAERGQVGLNGSLLNVGAGPRGVHLTFPWAQSIRWPAYEYANLIREVSPSTNAWWPSVPASRPAIGSLVHFYLLRPHLHPGDSLLNRPSRHCYLIILVLRRRDLVARCLYLLR